MRSNGPGEPRTPAQRRADALGEICRQWLDRSDRPSVGGERPHVTLTVGLNALCDLEAANDVVVGSSAAGHNSKRGPPIALREGGIYMVNFRLGR